MDKRHGKYIPTGDIYLFNTGNAHKAWLCFGCRYIPELEEHRFIVWAPNARRVTLVGDFNNWDRNALPMEKLEGGVWAVFVPGLKNGQRYKFCIDGADGRQVLKADPFAAFSQNGKENASIIWDGIAFPWGDEEYMKQRAKRPFLSSPMNIYEMHVGSWRHLEGYSTYWDLAEPLTAYCREMGYTHVELLPITEYPFDGSWGYQVTGYYAPTSRYGTPEDFKHLVDTLHRAGIGVIMDWVPAHFPKDEHGLARFDGSLQFECKEQRMAEHPEWGTLVFDYESDQVQSFLVSSACKFFEEYHIDGIRVDAVSSMLYLSYARKEGEYTPNKFGGDINLGAVDFMRKLNTTVLTEYPGAVTIAEEATAYPKITAPPYDGGLGFCFKWDMGFMHDSLDYMKLDPVYRSYNHQKLTFSMMYAFNENYILPYSHDEVVHGKLSMVNKMWGSYEEKFAYVRALYGYQYGHPGKKLTYMGSEFAQIIEWDEKRELDWFLLKYPKHDEVHRFVKELGKLYTENPALYEIDNSWDGFKWLNVDDAARSSIAFLRLAPDKDNYIVCACNFTPVRYDGFVIGLPAYGTLKELLNSDEQRFGGSGAVNSKAIFARKAPFLDMAYSAEITLPAMSAVFFRYKPRKKREKKG